MAENMSAKSQADVAWYHIMYPSNLGKKMRGPATDWKKIKFASTFSHSGAEFLCGALRWEEFQRTKVHGVTLHGGGGLYLANTASKRKDRSANFHARDLSSRNR